MDTSRLHQSEPADERASVHVAGLSQPPGPRGRRLRNLRERVLDFRGFMGRLHREYGDIVFYKIPGMTCCAVFDVELITEFMATRHDSFPAFQDKASYGVMKNPGVFRIDGEEHRLLHDVIEQSLSREMPSHLEIMLEQVRTVSVGWRPETVVDCRDEVANIVSGVMLKSIFGRGVPVTAEMAQEALWAVKWDWALSFMPVKTSWLRSLPIRQNRRFREAITTFDKVIFDTIRTARTSPDGGRSVIAHFVRSANRSDMKKLGLFDNDEKIRDEIYSIVLGNSDPPLNAIVHMIHYLGHNPRARQRLEEEVDRVLGGRPILAADLERLSYAHAVFRETIRLAPPAYGGNGQLKTVGKDCVLGGFFLPKGTMIHPCAGVPQRKPEYWEHPEEFRPERWLAKSGPRRPGCPAHAYMPFGLEPRACPGSTYATNLAVLAIAGLAQHVRFDPVSEEPPRPEPLGIGVKGPYSATVKGRTFRDRG